MNGNWASLYLTKHFGASTAMASLAPDHCFGAWSRWVVSCLPSSKNGFPERLVARVLPFLVSAAFLLSAGVPKTSSFSGILAFALAGLGCSALLPLAISFGQRATDDHRRLGGRRTDRFLSDWLRYRRLRGRPFANLGRIGFERHLRRHRRSCAGDGRAILCHHAQIRGASLTFNSIIKLTTTRKQHHES